MFVDSHCHINFPELAENIDELLANMAQNRVTHALCVSVNLPEWPSVMALADTYPNLYASVGVHPDYEDVEEPTVAGLVELAQQARVIAIGETGLDYYRLEGDLEWQRERFRVHIRAARETGLPLIIHTRSASEDTIRILKEERADEVGGVMHCFTESWEVAQAAMELGFYISFSGIVTFKKAEELKEVARRVPLERMLIETDSPYLAPMPFRGKTNQPAWVKHVAEHIADLRGVPLTEVASATTANFFKLFSRAAQ
ncbi:TatD family hydrolase [Chitinolyticbacter albus]|uniref:TatD family hydrolase n=1 Tax=Chitinolyticbacter albus TaxID=2961951 RepID=UPI002108D8E6|nr:TatD family hydrolase [Chitinolyticbacter albus]